MKTFYLSFLSIAICIFFSCSEDREKSELPISENQKEGKESKNTEKHPPSFSHHASLLGHTNQRKNNKEEQLKKKLKLNDILKDNLSFTRNKGQLERFYNISHSDLGAIEYYSNTFGGTAYFTKNGIDFGFTRGGLDQLSGEEPIHVESLETFEKYYKTIGFQLIFNNSNDDVSIIPTGPKEGKVNYFKGKIDQHITDITSYNAITYKNLYKDIDLKYYINKDELKYDYIVSPGGNIHDINMQYKGVDDLKLNHKGELEIHTSWGILIDKAPYSYQVIDGKKKKIDVRYQLNKNNQIGFVAHEKYDKDKPLVIDPPTLAWATFSGGNGGNGYIEDVTIDANGNIYGIGWYTVNFPNTAPVATFDGTRNGGSDAFVFKLSADGTTMLYAGYLGGDGCCNDEIGWGIAVDGAGETYVTGHISDGTNFPITGGAAQSSIAGGIDMFITKINAAGNAIVYSTFYGSTGDDRAYSIAVNNSGESYVTGMTTSNSAFTTGGGIQQASYGGGVSDAFVLKLNSTGTAVQYCTYYGGSSDDLGRGIAVNGNDAFITGATLSTTNIATGGAFDNTWNGGEDAFIARFDNNGSLVYGTYIGGGNQEKGEDIAVKSNNEAIITGYTRSNAAGGFPVVNAIQADNGAAGGGPRDAIMVRISADGSTLLNSTFMGGSSEDNVKNGSPFGTTVQGKSGAVDIGPNGEIAVVMSTLSTLPTVMSVDGTPNGGSAGLGDAYLFVTDPTGTSIIFSTYFGGSDNDYPTGGVGFHSDGCIYISGSSHSDPLPTTGGIYQPNRNTAIGPDQPYVVKYCDVVTPVQWLSFTAKAQTNNTVLLNWSTASEENNDYFEVLRSKDGINFEVIGIVDGSGNSASVQSYSFIDENPYGGLSYYKLRQVDYDGAWEYSKTASVLFDSQNLQVIQDGGQYYITGAAGEMDVSVILFTVNGQQVTEQTLTLNAADRSAIHINDLSSGVYIAKIITSSESISKKLLIQ